MQEPTAAVAIAHATAPPAITIIRLCLNVKYAANGDAKAWTRARMKVKVPRADGDTPKAFPTCSFPIVPERYEDEANFNKNFTTFSNSFYSNDRQLEAARAASLHGPKPFIL